jgi:hypothetical protein
MSLLTHPFGGGVPDGADRRLFKRAPVELLCSLDIPGLAAFYKAYIVDLSAGGMRLRLPKIRPDLLDQPFIVHWTMGGMALKRQVVLVRTFSTNEVAVRFVHVGTILADEIDRYVGITLKGKEIAQKPPEKAHVGRPASNPPPRPTRMNLVKNHMGPAEAAIESRNLHVSSVDRWLDRRVATQLRGS